MAEHEHHARHTIGHPRQSAGGDDPQAKLSRGERSQLRRVADVLRFADFMAALMVLATIFSAYAAWRTAKVTSLIFSVSNRPFLGVEKVAFEETDSPNPRITVAFRNFGRIPAQSSVVNVRALVDGKPVKTPVGEMATIDAGIVSPNAPHFFYSFIPAKVYKSVTAGESNLQVHVKIVYKGPEPEHEYCYFEKIAYDFRSASFRLSGGSDRCGSEIY